MIKWKIELTENQYHHIENQARAQFMSLILQFKVFIVIQVKIIKDMLLSDLNILNSSYLSFNINNLTSIGLQ